MAVVVSGTLLSDTTRLYLTLSGELLIIGAHFRSHGILSAVMISTGFLILLAAALLPTGREEPETGTVPQEWIGTGMLYSSLFVSDTGTRRILLLTLGFRFLFGLVFRIVPVRTPDAEGRNYARVLSWLPGITVLTLIRFSDDLSFFRLGVLWLFLFSRFFVLIDEARIRLRTLSSLVPAGERRGLWRSYSVYYLVPLRAFVMRRFYRSLVPRGGCAWDVGAHLGNRSRIWLNLGARVTAFEPQPSCASLLENWFGTCPDFTLKRAAVGSEQGRTVLNMSVKNPTLASVSSEWVDRMVENPLFSGIEWNRTIEVPIISLDEFRQENGNPDFIKIDVEGFENQVITGLGETAPDCLSFEILPSDRFNALKSIEILCGQSEWRWNVAIKEQFRFRWASNVSRESITRWIEDLGDQDPSGDIYAFRTSND